LFITDTPSAKFGDALRGQVEERLAFFETGAAPAKNSDTMRKVLDALKQEEDADMDSDDDEEADVDMAMTSLVPEPIPEKKSKKEKKDKKRKSDAMEVWITFLLIYYD
jgi:nucleolar protein 56